MDDEKLVRWSLRQKCAEWGYHVLEAESGAAALRVAQAETPDLVLLDVRLPDLGGLEVLQHLKQNGDARAIIMITADPQLDDVKAALKMGAYDFIGKPIDFDELEVATRNALENTRLKSEVEDLRGQMRRRTGYHEVIGVSQKMSELMLFVRKIAGSEATTILVQGESGTGKDLIAKAIHYESKRQDKPFVPINCSAIPETLMEAELFGHERGAFTDAKTMKKGLFEMADGGTLFLDEIGDMSLAAQAKVLRVLQDGVVTRIGGAKPVSVDVRVLAATNKKLEEEITAGRFREDLFYRLHVVPVHVPPLRERREDIPLLIAHFGSVLTEREGVPPRRFTPEAVAQLSGLEWPGNVRELRNT
ncbi:MAG TPA: sigma-54 dependent transcriptional regulator, partial [Ramlibacter sp.]|nr:sigma-54 dependent transcriptional regulator [Ramlibacter sp.]